MTDTILIRAFSDVLLHGEAAGGVFTTRDNFNRAVHAVFDGEQTVRIYRATATDINGDPQPDQVELIAERNPFAEGPCSRRKEEHAQLWLPDVLDEVLNPFMVIYTTDEPKMARDMALSMAAMPPRAYNNPRYHPCVQGTFASEREAARHIQRQWMQTSAHTPLEGISPDVEQIERFGSITNPSDAEAVWTLVEREQAYADWRTQEEESRRFTEEAQARQEQERLLEQGLRAKQDQQFWHNLDRDAAAHECYKRERRMSFRIKRAIMKMFGRASG